MWALVVTNQGFPVEIVLVEGMDDLMAESIRLQEAWHCGEKKQIFALDRPAALKYGAHIDTSVKVESYTVYVDNEKDPKYVLSQVRVKRGSSKEKPILWKFCPDCGCPWIHHLSGQASLEMEDWEPCACTECGCEKAISQ